MFQTGSFVIALQRYAKARNIAISTAGRLAVGNSDIADRIRTGQVTVRTLNRLIQYLSDHWPDGLEWPGDIPRPEARGGEAKAA